MFNMEDRRKTDRKKQRWHKTREEKHRQAGQMRTSTANIH